jgi:hypothetical protein
VGWSHGVTYAGPQAVYSRAALQSGLALMNNGSSCGDRTDDFALDACMWASGAVHVHSNLFEPVGDLGPGNSWSWQLPHVLLSCVAVRNTRNPPRAFTLFMMYYVENYGMNNTWPSRKGFGILDPLPPYPAIIGRRLGDEGGEGEEGEGAGAGEGEGAGASGYGDSAEGIVT